MCRTVTVPQHEAQSFETVAVPDHSRNSYFSPNTERHVTLLLIITAATAAASFMYEVGWIRMLSLVLGSATHSFELKLSTFILGLALGSFFIRKKSFIFLKALKTFNLTT